MPSLATGALFGDHHLLAIGVSGDGDTANIGMGQFKHIIRRNPPLVYIIENNGVYGLTKGQFSATAEPGLELKAQGVNQYMPIDIVVEALASRATFVARSFAGDAAQVKELIKAAMSHNGIAILDIISPCVTFNNRDDSQHSYTWNREHREMIHDFNYIPVKEEIVIEEDLPEGVTHMVTLHDGSHIVLKKLDRHYDPTDRVEALRAVQQATRENVLLTGLIFIDTERPSLFEMFDLPRDKPLNRFTQEEIRPSQESLKMINEMMF
jgi:2-oxoglutarate ferredoxin oxidoreductase subunit beta